MSETLQASRPGGLAQSFLHRYEGLRARLPGAPGERAQAANSFARMGLPGVREEAWKYTSLRALAEIEFSEPVVPVDSHPSLLDTLPAIDAPRLVYVDGRFRPELSTPNAAAGFAQTSDFGRLARPDRDAFAALNTMLAEDGARIAIPAGTDAGTLQIISIATDVHGRPVAVHPRHHIELGDGARLTLIDIALGEGTYLHNPLTEIIVGANARLDHLRLQDESLGAFHIATIYAEIGAGGSYDSFLLNMGARLSRTEVHARIGGDAGRAHLNCAQLLRGKQHGDFTTVLSHDAVGTQSRQTVRNVLDGAARGVFQGRINVAQIAQKTDGYQMNHALLLSPAAEIDSKPELRINADDVKCSHGATVGELDADQLFYLRSRGVPQQEARAMLIRGFLSESLADVANEPGRAMFEAAVDRWWERQAA
jgi:Fe-S cluster assembly protein SufD